MVAGTSLKTRALRGSAVSLVGHGANQLLRLLGNLILSRLLFPEAFGLMALVRLLMSGLQMISNVGIHPAIIRHERGEDRAFLDTAWSLQVIRGVVLWGAGCALAIPFARFYEDPLLLWLIPVATSTALLAGFQSTKLVTLTRRIELGRSVAINLISQLLAIGSMLVMAQSRPSVWVLVLGALVGGVSKLALSHWAIPGRNNRFRWEAGAVRDLWSFGRWVLVSTLFTFLALRIDVVLLGKLIPLDLLGVYSIGIMIAAVPRELAARVIQTVLMPALAGANREGHASLVRSYLRSRALVLPGGLLAILGAVAVAPAFFTTFYDARYHDAGWIAQLAMGTLWFSFLHDSAGRALLAVGDSRSFAISNGMKTAFTLLGCLAGFAQAGLPGLMVGAAIAALCAHGIVLFALRQHGLHGASIDLRFSALAGILGAAIGLGPHMLSDFVSPEAIPLVTLGAGCVLLLPLGLRVATLVIREVRT